MNHNKVYTLSLIGTPAAGATDTVNFEIENIGRRVLLKNIRLDLQMLIRIGGSWQMLPVDQNTTQDYILQISKQAFVLPVPPIAYHFANIAGAVGQNSGLYIELFRPQQISFNSFEISETIYFVWNYVNRDALNPASYRGSLLVETEEL